MSRPTERRRDAGFSLVEVVVALGIIMSLLVAVLPQLIGGIRATDIARRGTQAKALAASEVERLRNLPFQVQPNAGRYVDLFDRYFHDLGAPAEAPACTDAAGRAVAPTNRNTGYVPAGAPASARCGWELTPPFYRTVRTAAGDAAHGIAADPDLTGYVVSTTIQFLSSATPPAVVAPRAGYDTQVVGKDLPATAQVRATVTVLPTVPGDREPVTTSTQIARSYQTVARIRAVSDVTALAAGITTSDGTAVSVIGGLLNLQATLIAGSKVDATAAGVTATTGTGDSGGSGRTAFSAPPDVAATWSSLGGGSLTAAGCDLVCWGGAQPYGVWTPTTAGGLPGIGSPPSPVEATLKTPSTSEGYALRMGAGSGASMRSELGLMTSVLRLRSSDFANGVASDCSVSSSGSGLRLASGGWARSTALPSGGVDACAATHTAEVAVLPQLVSENPIVKIRLVSARARCQVTGATHTATTALSFRVEVSYWNGSSYTTLGPFTETSTSGLPTPSSLPISTGGTLARWIDSWSVASTASGITRTAVTGSARVEVPVIVNVATVPLRNEVDGTGAIVRDEAGNPLVDDRSSLSVSVGSLSCTAEDRR